MAEKELKEKLEGVTLDGKPVFHFIKEEADRESDALHKAHVRSASAGVGYVAPTSKFGNTSGERTQNKNLTALSPEVMAHLNFLMDKGGQQAVTEYLNMPKQQTEQLGSIESALRDTEEKIKFYGQQAEKAQQEQEKFSAVADSLRTALTIMQGGTVANPIKKPRQVRMVGGAPLAKLPHGYWPQAISRLLADGRVVERQTLLDELRNTAPDSPPDLAQAALTRAVSLGMVLVDKDRRVRLADSYQQ